MTITLNVRTQAPTTTTVEQDVTKQKTQEAIHNAVINSVSSTLVRKNIATPKQALATAVALASTLENMDYHEQWKHSLLLANEEASVNGESVSDFNMLNALTLGGFTEDNFTKVRKMMVLQETYAPIPVGTELDRVKGYSTLRNSKGNSKLFKEAVHILEKTEFTVSQGMLDIANQVEELVKEDKALGNYVKYNKFMDEKYVVDGCAKMDSTKAYFSEFFGDKRGRLYQACHAGPNGQSSDKARALMDLYGVSGDYDAQQVADVLLDEMYDMGDFTDIESDIQSVLDNPAEFIFTHMDKCNHVSKPWNFTKFALLIGELLKGNKPYIGVAVGLDAKCSGPQLAALMLADNAMLAATGFTTEQLDDAYENALVECSKAGITGLTRALVKKSFMAIFYGASVFAMTDEETITPKTFYALYQGLSAEEVAVKADKFHTAIVRSFGAKLNHVRSLIKQAGVQYGEDGSQTPKMDKPLRHIMPDGFEVGMEYMQMVDIDGAHVDRDYAGSTTTVKVDHLDKTFKDMKFSTGEYAYTDFARTGFVNMIQATDALLARLIIKWADKLGAKHIIAIHDCFRVNIHEMSILEDAIKAAYIELFTGSGSTENLPMGKDILDMYFKGSKEATKEEFKDSAPHYTQYVKGQRKLRSVNGVFIKDLIKDLGKTCYFSK